MHKEMDVTIQSAVKLQGTLTQPDRDQEKFPAVLIIGGTGKIDRNGRVNKKLHLHLYEQLAETFTELGFVTLRYDKRGIGESEGDYNATGMWDLVEDTKACVTFLKQHPIVDAEKVLVVGHSEGSTIATALAVREPLAGIILLAGACERIEEALVRQRAIAKKDILEAKGMLGKLLRLLGTHNKIEKQAQAFMKKVMASTNDTMKVQFQTINAKWMREHFSYDVLSDLALVTCPVLAITGANDIQADPGRLAHLQEFVKENATARVIEHMGHSMKFQEQPSTMFNVKKDIIKESSLPLHPELVKEMDKWVKNLFLRP